MRHLRKRNKPDWPLLVRYLAGECTEREEAEVQARIAVDEEASRLLDELQRVWEASEGSSAEVLGDDAGWQLLSRRLRQSAGSVTSLLRKVNPSREAELRVPSWSSRPARRRRSHARGHSWGVAAVLIAVVLAGLLGVLFAEPPQLAASADVRVIETAKGQRSLIRLEDGTQVTLNADSRLTLPDGGFAEDQREVRLEGEAYFEVAEDATRPFVVHAKNASVRVLGTAFVVQAYADELTMQVAVAAGQVALRPDDSEGRDTTVVLEPHQLGVVSATGVHTVRRETDLSPYLAWTKGRLVFNDAPFGEVARRLERWYDLRIDVQVPIAGIDRLDATFEEATADQVLNAIAAALDLQYTKDRQTVTFYRQWPGPSIRITK